MRNVLPTKKDDNFRFLVSLSHAKEACPRATAIGGYCYRLSSMPV